MLQRGGVKGLYLKAGTPIPTAVAAPWQGGQGATQSARAGGWQPSLGPYVHRLSIWKADFALPRSTSRGYALTDPARYPLQPGRRTGTAAQKCTFLAFERGIDYASTIHHLISSWWPEGHQDGRVS